MFKPASKVLVVVAMLIAFVGQALAYSAMACEMAGDTHQAHMTHSSDVMDISDMNHEGMNHESVVHESMGHHDHSQMVMDHANANSGEDCCGINCMCPANACTAFTFITERLDFNHSSIASEAPSLLTVAQPNSLPTSLYRPPIIA